MTTAASRGVSCTCEELGGNLSGRPLGRVGERHYLGRNGDEPAPRIAARAASDRGIKGQG